VNGPEGWTGAFASGATASRREWCAGHGPEKGATAFAGGSYGTFPTLWWAIGTAAGLGPVPVWALATVAAPQ
jgi:hypothetical protein